MKPSDNSSLDKYYYLLSIMYRLDQGESYLPDQQTSLEDRYYNNQTFQVGDFTLKKKSSILISYLRKNIQLMILKSIMQQQKFKQNFVVIKQDKMSTK
jgi:hypothetical protein